MSTRATFATARRVLSQLRGDPRTLAMVFVVPPALVALFKYVFDQQPQTFERIGTPLVGLFPLVVMFLVSKATQEHIPHDVHLKMLRLHAPEEMGISRNYIEG